MPVGDVWGHRRQVSGNENAFELKTLLPKLVRSLERGRKGHLHLQGMELGGDSVKISDRTAAPRCIRRRVRRIPGGTGKQPHKHAAGGGTGLGRPEAAPGSQRPVPGSGRAGAGASGHADLRGPRAGASCARAPAGTLRERQPDPRLPQPGCRGPSSVAPGTDAGGLPVRSTGRVGIRVFAE